MPTYSTTSKYVQLTPYLVMEYMYADQPNPETYFVSTGNPTVSYDKLINGIIKGPGGTASNDVQNFNQSQNYNVTKNTSLNSVVKVSDNSYITLDPNYIIPFNDFSPDLTSSANLPVIFSSNFSITYDSVRYHILAGYNLGNIDGIILGVDFLDVDGSYVTFSQIFIDSGFASQYTLNPSPLMIGINSYDKYFEVKIPSLLFLNNQYISSQTPNLTPSSLLSKSGNGFVVGSPMRVRVYEILNTTLTAGYATYGANLVATLSLESEDPFANIGALIAPADTGDFFEFFGTDNNGFIEDFILFQNSIGNQYYIQNNIEVLELIGTALIQTANFFTIQTNAYNIPNLYRPIVRNPGIAASFTLRYTMTLVNSADQSRVTRIASFTSSSPARYGPYIAPLQLQNLPQAQKIYNKLATETNITVPNSNPTPRTIIKYSNVFYERSLVNTTLTNLVVKGNTITSADGGVVQDQTVYGLGQAYIYISPFDSFYKFTFYKQGPAGNTQLIDLESSGTYFMVFINNSNMKVSAPSIDNKNIANPAKGELAFKVSETLSTEILQFTNRKYYISNRPPATSDPNVIQNQIATTAAANASLAARATALSDSTNDIILAARQANQGLNSNTLTISSDSSSVLYWGSWLKEGEPEPIEVNQSGFVAGSTGISDAISAQISASLLAGVTESVQPTNTRSSWQIVGNADTPIAFPINSNPVTLSANKSPLSPTELKSAIGSTVQGQLVQGWNVEDIISYFLDPTQPGYKLYVGITKQIFVDSVTGIFNDADLNILNNYGNTRSGQTNGGPASLRGSSVSLTGGDNGSANSEGDPSNENFTPYTR